MPALSELYIALAAVGGLLLVLGLLAGLINEISPFSEPLVALLAGVLIGPAAFGLLDLASFGDQQAILEQGALVTLGIALMGVALRLPREYAPRNWRSLAVLLGFLMPLMWLSSGLLAYLILGLPLLVAVLIGAVVTPTDPVVASSIVTGATAERNLPDRLRHTISAESGFNDGLALPFIALPVLLLTRPPGEALWHWLTRSILWEVGAGAVLGALIGYAAAKALRWAEAKGTGEHTSLLTVSLALSLTVLGATELIGLDGILATFVGGLVFHVVATTQTSEAKERQEHVQEAITRFFDLPIFVLLGMALPWEGWLALGWGGLLLAVAVLLLRRLPAVLVLRPLLGQVQGRRDALFLGWFGPIGAAALFYAAFALRETGIEEVWVVCSLIICASVVAHGLTSTSLTKLYGRRARHEWGRERDMQK